MYYIERASVDGARFLIGDTADDVLEWVTKEDLASLEDCQIFTLPQALRGTDRKVFFRQNNKFYRHLLRNDKAGDVQSYLEKRSVLSLSEAAVQAGSLVSLTKPIKTFNYSEIQGMYLVSLYLENDNVMIARCTEHSDIYTKVIPRYYKFRFYPCMAGSAFMRLSKMYQFPLGLFENPEDLYMLMYSADDTEVISINISDVDMSYRQVDNPNKIILGGS